MAIIDRLRVLTGQAFSRNADALNVARQLRKRLTGKEQIIIDIMIADLREAQQAFKKLLM